MNLHQLMRSSPGVFESEYLRRAGPALRMLCRSIFQYLPADRESEMEGPRKYVPSGIFLRQVQRRTVIQTVVTGSRSAVISPGQVRPFDPDRRIIPGQSAFIVRMIKICTLVAEFGYIREHQEPMRKSFGDIKLLIVLFRQLDAEPFTESRASLTKIHRNVKNGTADDADKLALRVFLLKMKAAQHSFYGRGLVVLNKYHVQAGFSHIILIVGFHKIAALVSVHCRLYDIETFNRRLSNFNLSHAGFSSFSDIPELNHPPVLTACFYNEFFVIGFDDLFLPVDSPVYQNLS